MRHRTVSRPIDTDFGVRCHPFACKWMVVVALVLIAAKTLPAQTQSPGQTPFVSFNTPNPFNLPGTITQGTSSSPQNITISNTGNAPLHISAVVLGGFNAGDFSVGVSNCSGAVAASSNCVIPLTFSPQAAGIRSATITVTDDAANSPQVLTVSGNAIPAASFNPPSGGSTTASVNAGQTAQFELTATPGSGFSGTLTFTCSGAPFGAICNVPASIAVTSGTAAAFTVSVSTTSAATMFRAPARPPFSFTRQSPLVFLLSLAIFLILFLDARMKTNPLRIAQFATTSLMLALLISSGIGCGGGPSIQSPPPQTQTAAMPSITPNGGTFSTDYPTVTISDSTPGATIHYTVDNSAPTTASPTYATPFMLNSAATVQAIATVSGYTASAVASASFKLQTASGNYAITVTPTAVASGSTKKLPMNPITLSLTVK